MPLQEEYGPQLERNKLFSENDLGIVESEDIVLPMDGIASEQLYQRKLQKVEQENMFLKKYIQRILSELKRVLVKHGEYDVLRQNNLYKNNASPLMEEESHKIHPPWFTSEEYMNPVLLAYDGRMAELEKSCDTAKMELESLTKQAESIVLENEQLRSDLSGALEKLIVNKESSNGEDGMQISEEIGELQERIDILMAENNLIMEQNTSNEQDLVEARADIEERDNQLITMGHNFEHAKDAVMQLKQDVEALRGEKKSCEKQLQKVAAKAAQLENDKKRAEKELNTSKVALEEIKVRLRESEQILAQAKLQSTQTNGALSSKYQVLTKRIRELTLSLEDQQGTHDELVATNTALHAELDTAKNDCEGILKVLSGMESQLEEYASREESVNALEKNSKIKAEEALLERDQALSREAQSRKEIARLLERRKLDAATNIKAQEEACEDIRKRLSSHIKSRDAEITNLTSEMEELKTDRERLDREKETMVSELAVVKERLTDERLAIQSKFEQYSARISTAEEARDKHAIAEELLKEDLQHKARLLESTIAEGNLNSSLLQDKVSSLEREISVRRAELRQVQQSKDEKEHRVETLMRQIAEIKVEGTNQLAKQQEMYQEQIVEQKNRLYHAENELFNLKESHAKTETQHRLQSERSLIRRTSEIEQMENTCARLREDKIRLEGQIKELSNQISSLDVKSATQLQTIQEKEDQLHQLQCLLDEAERKASELSSQIALTLSKQQQQLRVEKETRTALDRCKLEKTRMEREIHTLRNSISDAKSIQVSKVAEKHIVADNHSL